MRNNKLILVPEPPEMKKNSDFLILKNKTLLISMISNSQIEILFCRFFLFFFRVI